MLNRLDLIAQVVLLGSAGFSDLFLNSIRIDQQGVLAQIDDRRAGVHFPPGISGVDGPGKNDLLAAFIKLQGGI